MGFENVEGLELKITKSLEKQIARHHKSHQIKKAACVPSRPASPFPIQNSKLNIQNYFSPQRFLISSADSPYNSYTIASIAFSNSSISFPHSPRR
jgi:hypothetical protein